MNPTLEKTVQPNNPLIDKILAKVETVGGCWLWRSKSKLGYGSIVVEGKTRSTHRVFYELTIGKVPEGLELDHLCRNTLCLRPEHLEPVTHAENIHRGLSGVLRNPENKCKRGHELTPDNCYYNKQVSGRRGRFCRRCNIDRCKARYRRLNNKRGEEK